MNILQQMEQCLESIRVFNEIAGNLSKPVNYELEYKMLKSEVLEYYEASIEGSEVKQKDAVADIMVVLWGTILKHGWGSIYFKVLIEVCKSNFTKFPETADEAQQTQQKYLSEGINTTLEFNEQYQVYVIKDMDGKVLKPINFHLPQI